MTAFNYTWQGWKVQQKLMNLYATLSSYLRNNYKRPAAE